MNSLFRRKNSLFPQKNSLFFCAQGICLQRTEIAARFDAESGENAVFAGNFSKFPVTAQVGLISYEKRRDFATFAGSRVKASIMFQPCFLAVERNDRMVAKSIAPCNDRKPPDIFCRSFIMRPSRSA